MTSKLLNAIKYSSKFLTNHGFKSNFRIIIKYNKNVVSYVGRFVSEEERLVGQHVREHFEISLSKCVDLFGRMDAHSLSLDFFGALEPLNVQNFIKFN